MNATLKNPATEAFIAWVGARNVLAQVLIEKVGTAFHLRHSADEKARDLKLLNTSQLRAMAQETAQRSFRPLKSAPNLENG
ncbi:MAG TPA: DR2241 family protein, partial [Candidatus Saccharimonadales bacterium]|nr:DR2241 family protein [Candidatus Saccharimonadales bacterium]